MNDRRPRKEKGREAESAHPTQRRAEGGSRHLKRSSCRRPGCGNWCHRRGGMNATPGSAGAGPSRAQVPKGSPRRAPHLGADRRPGPHAQPGTVTHPAPTRPLFPPHRTGPTALTSRPDPAETQLRSRRKSANGRAGRARPRARAPPGRLGACASLPAPCSRGGGGGGARGKPARPPPCVELSCSGLSWGSRSRGVA